MNSGYTEPSKARSSIASPSSSASSSSASNEPIKAGYLSKYNRGKWNAKRKWRQRWFVLENGVLMFFKSAPSAKSKKKAVPRDVFALGPSSKLTFPKDELPSITPSPFCFAVTASDSAKRILLCASSQQEFREWTALISATINPEAPPVVPPTPVYAMEQLQEYDNVMPPTSPMSPARSTLESPTVAIGACLVLNPLMVLHFDLLVTAIVLLAALWCLSFLLTHRPSDLKVDNIGSKIQLPCDVDGRTDLMILNTQVPCYAPSNPLLLKWFFEEDSAVRDRLKAIVRVANPADQKLGRMERTLLDTYNGQPLMTRPEHRFYRGDGYFEVDIDAHLFNFLARKGLTGITQHFGNMVVDFGFVMEGQDDDELPENVFGSGRMCRVDVNAAHHLSFR
ncbi:hypothetical protein DYB37_000367 [Aphanomyces astaci]|uniref:PH domain-containing protein n=1 Tax=Aphanomyces astaci TaxID=112090 RepID=A0A418FT32_APHAT|nr:hypothetical protein DYB26_010906 [Aphanomyces astaci]RHZ34685.1 hypothetical protein DYB37_000367 [Aphanomyces astaci]